MREALKGWGRRLARPQRQAGALTAVQPRQRGRGIETPAQAAVRARFDLALVAVLSDGGCGRSEAAALTWGRAALGRRQRLHHRHPLQDRRGGPRAPWSPSLPPP